MESEKQSLAQSNLYPSAPTGDTYPPPYAAVQSPPPGGMAYPQGPPQQPAYQQSYPAAAPQQPYGQPGYPSATQQPYGQAGYPGAESGPPAYGYPAPGAVSYGQPQVVVLSAQPQGVVVASPNSVSMIGAIVLSCFVFWCCGCLVGLVAFVLARKFWRVIRIAQCNNLVHVQQVFIVDMSI